jgi:putative transcriptional regulator
MNLAGKMLIAMPGMGDPRFAHAVIYLCAHSESGAMGLIVNKPVEDLEFSQLLQQLGIARGPRARDIRVHIGGPVEHGRGFVLHSGDYSTEGSTLKVDEGFAMTTTLDVLQALAEGGGPERSILALGYSGWGPGQLEAEIGANGWLTCEASPDLVFQQPDGRKWESALRSIGVDPLGLSARAGRA